MSYDLIGDSNTVAAIACSMAEAKWGVPKEIRGEVERRLDKKLKRKVNEFRERIG